MTTSKSVQGLTRSLLIAATLPFAAQAQVRALGTPAQGQAQERILGTFSGRVDKEVRITMRGSDVSSNTLSGQELRARYRAASPLPQQEGTVRVAVNSGRGDVSVIQQPTAANGYTAIIRIFDRSSGNDVYRVSTYFTPQLDVQSMRRGGMGGRGRRANLPALHWTGDVDGMLELTWRGGTVQSRTFNGRSPRGVALTNSGDMTPVQNGAMPDAQVVVTAREGRGQVEVVQQPTAANRYTTRIRITDPAPGYGHYDFDAIWR